MTSRERLLGALSRDAVDRVPISTFELVGYNSASFENKDPSYRTLMDAVRSQTDCVCMWEPGTSLDDRGGFTAYTSCPVSVDLEESREGNATVRRKTAHTPGGALTCATKVFDDVHTTWTLEHWCKSPDDVDKYLSVPYEPVEYDFSDYARISGEVGDHGIIMTSIGDPLCYAVELMEMGAATVWALTEMEHFARTVERFHEAGMANLRRMLDAQVVDLYRIYGAEYASPPYMPIEIFERCVVPHTREMVDLIHERGAKARLHCHGNTGSLLELFAATGADAVDPCEAPPDGDVTLAEVKARLGDRMCLFGNVQLKLLEHGSREEVAEEVRRCMEAAKGEGGYVIMPTAAPINTPLAEKTLENYLTYFEAALEHGRY